MPFTAGGIKLTRKGKEKHKHIKAKKIWIILGALLILSVFFASNHDEENQFSNTTLSLSQSISSTSYFLEPTHNPSPTSPTSIDALDAFFLEITPYMSRDEIKSLASFHGLYYHSNKVGTGNYTLRITGTSRRSVNNIFSPETEKQDCIAITINGLNNDRIECIEYFNLSRMVSGFYFADGNQYHGSGYYLVDYHKNQKGSDYCNNKVSYQPMTSAQSIVQYIPASRDNASNPLIELFLQINEHFSESDIISFIENKNLCYDTILSSGTKSYCISYTDDIVAQNAQKGNGNYLLISMTRASKRDLARDETVKSELLDVTYYDFESLCTNGLSAHYYSPLFSATYQNIGRETGYYFGNLRCDSAFEAISNIMP